MENIKEEDIICIIPASPSLQQIGFTVCHLSSTAPVSTSITHILLTPPPHLFPYFIQLPHRFPSHLRLSPQHIHVILSTGSGSGDALQVWERVVRPVLHATGLGEESYRVLKTETQNTVRQFAGGVLRVEAAEGRAQTVLVLSGDGGVVDLLNGIMGDKRSSKFLAPKLVLFPLGTANALFHSLHRSPSPATHPNSGRSAIPDLVLALRTLLFGGAKPLPTFRANFSPGSCLLTDEGRSANPIPKSTLYGAIVASYGLHSTLVADSDTAEWRKKGAERFALVAHKLLTPPNGSLPHAYRARVTMKKPSGPEDLKTNEHGYILLTFVSNLEKKFTISPSSQPLDGQLRLVHFGNETAQEVGRILGGAYRGGEHVTDPKVDYEAVQGAVVEFLDGQEGDQSGRVDTGLVINEDEEGLEGRWRRVCIDGHIVRVEKDGWMNVETLPRRDWPLCVVVGGDAQVYRG